MILGSLRVAALLCCSFDPTDRDATRCKQGYQFEFDGRDRQSVSTSILGSCPEERRYAHYVFMQQNV